MDAKRAEITKEMFVSEAWELGDRIFSVAPTWVLNNKLTFESFLPDLRRRWAQAARDYGCKVTASDSAYFRSPQILDTMANPKRLHPFDEKGRLEEWFRPGNYDYFMHVDLSSRHDSSGFAMVHYDERKDKIVVDFVLQIDVPEGGELILSRAKNLILGLDKMGFALYSVTYDGWQCCQEDTLIPLLDGSVVKIKELALRRDPFWVYSCVNERVVPALATARLSYEDAPMVRVSFDNGKYLDCTENHRFMLRSGEYRMAGDLVVGESLMPLYRHYCKGDSKNYYERIWHPSGGAESTHALVARCILGWDGVGVIHHKDFCSRNNSPENLVAMDWGDHSSYHNKLLWPEWRREAQKEVMRLRNMECKVAFDLARVEAGKTRRESGVARQVVLNQWVDEGFKEKMRAVRSAQFKKYYEDPAFIERRELARKLARLNHKVVSVEKISNGPVFDLSVPGTNNFALESGVFVHNSLSTMQELKQMGIAAGYQSVDRDTKAYDTLVDVICSGKLDYYKPSPWIDELKDIRLVGKKVDHPKDGSKDCCFVGETKVRLLDGRVCSLKELYDFGGEVWAYGVKDGRVVPARAKAIRAEPVEFLAKTVLDNGEVIRSTLDHRFMLRDGSFAEAKDLRKGVSLMPFYRRLKRLSGELQYEQVKNLETGRWEFTHRVIMNPGKGMAVHHKNGRRVDNRPENLEVLSVAEHYLKHKGVNVILGDSEDLRCKNLALYNNRPEVKKAQSERAKELQRKIKVGVIKMDHGHCAESLRKYSKTEDFRIKQRALVRKMSVDGRLNTEGLILWMRSEEGKEKMREREKARVRVGRGFNHKVEEIFIEKSDLEPVYCLSTEIGNFALEAGVFVHNSDALSGAVYSCYLKKPLVMEIRK